MTTGNRCLRALLWFVAVAGAAWMGVHHAMPRRAMPPEQEGAEVQVEAARQALPNPERPQSTTAGHDVHEAPAQRTWLTDEQLLERVRALVGDKPEIVRQGLVSLFDEVFVVADGHHPDLVQPFLGRWTLPEEFAASLLEAILPLLEVVHECDPPSDDMKFLLMALEVLQRMRYAPAVAPLLRDDGVPALGEMTPWTWPRFGVAAVQPLAELVRSGTERGRAQALVALREIRDPAAVPALTLIVERDPKSDLRAAASQALRGIGLPRDLDRFRGVATSPTASFGERREAVIALAENGSAADLEFLLRLIESVLAAPAPRPDDAVDIAAEAVHALLERGDPKAVAYVIRLVERRDLDPQANEELRNRAIEDLGLFGVLAAQPVLVAVMNDEADDLRTRWWAAGALARIDPDHEAEYMARVAELDERWQAVAGAGGK